MKMTLDEESFGLKTKEVNLKTSLCSLWNVLSIYHTSGIFFRLNEWSNDCGSDGNRCVRVCRDVFWRVCGSPRWRSVWTWSNRCRTAPTRSWRPACRVSRGPTWRRDPSSRRRWVTASNIRLTPRRSWSAYESHPLISFLSAARKNSRSRSWLSVWWRVPRCWGTTLCWGKSSLIIDSAIGFFSPVLVTLVCILIASDCVWLSPPTGRCWSCVGRRRRSWPRSSSSSSSRSREMWWSLSTCSPR